MKTRKLIVAYQKYFREKIANFAFGWKVKTMLLYNITLESWTTKKTSLLTFERSSPLN